MPDATMIRTHPRVQGAIYDAVSQSVEACVQASLVFNQCADACLGEADPAGLVECIRACQDAADVCQAHARIASRHTGHAQDLVRTLLQACVAACRTASEKLGAHVADRSYCRVCAQACSRCALACQEALTSI